MTEMRVAAERTMAASPDKDYRVLADYREHHPRILPPAFSGFTIEDGGMGAGTRFRVDVKTGGRTLHNRMRVDEPEPGRMLTESDQNTSLVTTFSVTPEGTGSRVKIETVWDGAGRFSGVMERLFAPGIMRKLYADELNRLEAYAGRR